MVDVEEEQRLEEERAEKQRLGKSSTAYAKVKVLLSCHLTSRHCLIDSPVARLACAAALWLPFAFMLLSKVPT